MTQVLEYDIFLCHSAEDKEAVNTIACELTKNGLRAWYDEWNIPHGGDIMEAIENGIQKSRAFVICVSEKSLKSDWVSMELRTVQFEDPANKTRRIIPLLLDDCASQLPMSLKRLRHINYSKDSRAAILALESACRVAPMEIVQPVSTTPKLSQAEKPAVLFVDDEELSRKYFSKLFRDEYTTHLAGSVEDALLILISHHQTIAAAFVDQRLPNRKGTDLLGIMRRSYPKIRRVMVSAYADFDALVDAINIGAADGYLYKPWDPVHLQLVARTAVEAYLSNESSPGFVLPIAPAPKQTRTTLVSNSQTVDVQAPSAASLQDDKVYEELKRQGQALQSQDEKIRQLELQIQAAAEQEVSHIEPKEFYGVFSNRSYSLSSNHTESMRGKSVGPTLKLLLEEISLISISLDYDYPVSFRIFRPRPVKRLSRQLEEIHRGLSSFDESQPVSAQFQVLDALQQVRMLILLADDERNTVNKIIKSTIAARAAMKSIAGHYSVLESYLKLDRGLVKKIMAG